MGALLALCIDLLTGTPFVLSCLALAPPLCLFPYAHKYSNPLLLLLSLLHLPVPLCFFFDKLLILSHLLLDLSQALVFESFTLWCLPTFSSLSSLCNLLAHPLLSPLPPLLSYLNFPFILHLIFPDYLLSHTTFTPCRARTSHFPRIRTAGELDHEGASKKR